MSRITRRTTVLVAGVALAGLAWGSAAAASGQGGADLMRQLSRGDVQCEDLSSADFTAIGEQMMGRMLGSPRAHESMDELMSRMMGGANEERVHEAMGERVAGCGNPAIPGGFGSMMGAMGMMGRFNAGVGDRPFAPGAYADPGSMMALSDRGDRGRDDDVPVGWMIAMMLLLVAGAVVAVYVVTRSRRGPGPGRRYAAGEIDAEEFRRRSDLLEGGR
jgi:hypothetical protein